MTDKSDLLQQLTKALTDQGKLIEAGWVSYKLMVLPASAGPVQIDETRKAFFAGCQHLFASIMTVLDPGEGPTENDLRRMGQIQAELSEYLASLQVQEGAPS